MSWIDLIYRAADISAAPDWKRGAERKAVRCYLPRVPGHWKSAGQAPTTSWLYHIHGEKSLLLVKIRQNIPDHSQTGRRRHGTLLWYRKIYLWLISEDTLSRSRF